MSLTVGGAAGIAVQADYIPAPPPPGVSSYSQPSLADYLIFLRNFVGIPEGALPDDSPWITISYNLAMAKVNNAFGFIAPQIYTLMVYYYATDRLLNFCPDQSGMCYFADLRKSLGVTGFTPGIIQSSSDQGTSQSWMLPDWLRNMTLSSNQMMSTPYGRAYLAWAQEYGSTIWGLTV